MSSNGHNGIAAAGAARAQTDGADDARLRVHLVTEDDPLYVIRFFETFFREYPRDVVEIVGITIQPSFNESRVATARRVLRLYGPVNFTRLLSRVAVAKLRRQSIAALARRESIPVVSTPSVNDERFVETMRELDLDVIVSVAAPEIFREPLLRSARLGSINIHSGRLPVYRGMMPIFWQMHGGEQHATVTVHEMAPKLDAGAVLGTVDCPIDDRDSLDRVITETKREGARLMIRVLRELAAGTATPRRLDMTNASYFSFPGRVDSRAFRQRGHRLV